MNKLLSVFCIFLFGCGNGGVNLVTKPGNCSVSTVNASPAAPNGGALISCTDGSSSLVLNGEKGNTGDTGSKGDTGEQGTSGTPGTMISAIKLCDGTTTYASTFIEVAFCIDNKMWAVYSLNGGFLTELPPGNYNSNGVGSSCTFTIGNNCQVTM